MFVKVSCQNSIGFASDRQPLFEWRKSKFSPSAAPSPPAPLPLGEGDREAVGEGLSGGALFSSTLHCAGWEEQPETSSAPRLAIQSDPAVVVVHDFRDDGKAEADSRLLRGKERVKNLFAMSRRNAGAGVFNGNRSAV